MFNIENLKNNRKSGLTVATINIPLSISLAVASGATPLQGLLTGIWAGVFSALFASSEYNIFGVAGALSSILLAFVMTNGENGVLMLPILAIVSGLIMLLVYFLKITKYITLIPSTTLHGFLISVGVTIALGQVSAALGLNDPALHIVQHKEIYMNLLETFKNLGSTNIVAFGTFLLGLGFLSICKKKFPNFPSVIVLTVVGIGVGLGVANGFLPKMLLLSDKFKDLSFSLFELSYFKLIGSNYYDLISLLKPVLMTSFVIAIISILETVISAKIAEKITKRKFDKDKEVLGLSIANMASGLMGGLPSTAVFIRTALNIKSGATSKMSAMYTAIFTLIISAILFNGFFKFLPFPIIAAILINIALGLIDINLLKRLYKLEKTAFLITLITALLSVLVEPTYGILAGTIISLMIFIKKVTYGDTKVSIFRNKEFFEKLQLEDYLGIQKKGDIILMKFNGGLNYLNIENNIAYIEQLDKGQKIIISFTHMGVMDIDGLESLEEMIDTLISKNIDVYVSGLNGMEKVVAKLHFYKGLKDGGKIIDSTPNALNKLLSR